MLPFECECYSEDANRKVWINCYKFISSSGMRKLYCTVICNPKDSESSRNQFLNCTEASSQLFVSAIELQTLNTQLHGQRWSGTHCGLALRSWKMEMSVEIASQSMQALFFHTYFCFFINWWDIRFLFNVSSFRARVATETSARCPFVSPSKRVQVFH